ncbi:MAG: hypothetical protein [Caudoviricetes sp.]|nr:MAG: hypothetical protein [Caudoviricetes sp.]
MTQELRPMTEDDVRRALIGVPKSQILPAKILTVQSYCRAVYVKFDKELTIATIEIMNQEPGDRH